MSDDVPLKKLRFESYNAMSRPAMQWGIPIMPMVGLLMGGWSVASLARCCCLGFGGCCS